MSVEPAEARRRKRLIHGREVVDPRIALGHGRRVLCEQAGKLGIEKVRNAGPDP